jgi:hypothetical protein
VQARLQAQQAEKLGITSYSKVYNYLYINERSVRHELLIPLLQLDEWLSSPGSRDRVLDVAAQKALHEPIRSFLEQHQRVETNAGQVLNLTSLNIRFFGPGIRDLATVREAEPVTVHNARVGIIAEYATVQPAREVHFYWNYYTGRFPFFEGWLYAYAQPREAFTLYSRKIPLRWEDAEASARIELLPLEPPPTPDYWYIPVWSSIFCGLAMLLLIVGCMRLHTPCGKRLCILLVLLLVTLAVALMDVVKWPIPNPLQTQFSPNQKSVDLLSANLLQNIYQAFAFSDELSVYNTLAKSVDGGLLRSIYLDIRRSILNREQGGAVARIHAVDLRSAVLRKAVIAAGGKPVMVLECEWTVLGSVEHWGHVHTRKNLHRAVIGLIASAEGWRVQSFEPLTEERVEESISVRR